MEVKVEQTISDRSVNIQDKISNVCYKIFTSHIFMLLLTIIAVLSFSTKTQVPGATFFICLMIIQALFVKDISCMLLPFTLISMMFINMYLATPADYSTLVALAIVFLVAFFLHFFIFRIKIKLGKQFWVLCFVSLAVLWGGGLVASFEDWLNLKVLYFTFGLSLGMLATYVACRNSMFIDKKSDCLAILAKSMVYVGVMGILMLFPYMYGLLVHQINYDIQWQNNLSTFMFISMPFAFYYSTKTNFGIVYFCLGILEYIVCFFTFSRSGMLLGTVLVILLIAISFFANKRKIKWLNLIPTALLIAIAIIILSNPETIEMIKQITKIDFENEARAGLIETAIENFKRNPLFGVGLGFVGDDYVNKGFTIYLIHSAPFQVLGSFGLVGILAYGIQFFQRIYITLGKAKIFNFYIFMSLAALELMSLVNPGVMCPLPYGLLLVVICTIAEIANEKNTDESEQLKYKFMIKHYAKINDKLIKKAKEQE